MTAPFNCRHCDMPLTDATWALAQRRWNNKICHECYKQYQREHFQRHRGRYCAKTRAHSFEARAAMLEAYGGACACCGETTPAFLTLDHVDGDGAVHRARLSGGSAGIARWLRSRGWPKEGFQLLCWNCNKGKYVCGRCPHEERRAQKVATA